MYVIKSFDKKHLSLYKKCFSDTSWVRSFGFNETSFDFNKYLKESVLKEYPNVQRIIVLDKNNCPLAFSHLCFHENRCVVVGGVTPHLISRGTGVSIATVVYDYLFEYYVNIENVTISVLASNTSSLKMNMSLGFKIISNTITDIGGKYVLILKRDTFPNQFALKLLKRVEYDVC